MVQFEADVLPRLGQGLAPQPGIKEVPGLLESRGRHSRGQLHEPVFHRPILEHHHGEGLADAQGDELHVLDPGLPHRRDDDTCAPRQAGQEDRGLVEHVLEGAPASRQPRLDLPAICIGNVAQLHQTVDKEPQAGMGGKPPGADVRGAQQAKFGQVLHGIADGGRGELDAAPGEGKGTDRLSGLQIALDHTAEDVAGAAVEFG